jgi:superfamily II DNA/RNA helicase
MTDEQRAEHGALDQPIARLLRTSKVRPLTQPEFLKLMSLMTQQRIICNGLAQRDFEALWPGLAGQSPTEATLRGLFSPKLTEFRELVANLVVTQRRKVVVFSQWKRMLHLAQWAVSDLLAGSGVRAVQFTGDESQKRRTQNVVDFHDDPHTRLFFATDAGGVGLNLQRSASACVHLDLPWNPAVMEQRAGRVYRLGQTSRDLFPGRGRRHRSAHRLDRRRQEGALRRPLRRLERRGELRGGSSFLAKLQETLEPTLEAEPVPLAEAAEPKPPSRSPTSPSPNRTSATPWRRGAQPRAS